MDVVTTTSGDSSLGPLGRNQKADDSSVYTSPSPGQPVGNLEDTKQVPTHLARDGDGATLLLLGEGDDTGDGRVTLEDSDSLEALNREAQRHLVNVGKQESMCQR